MAVVTLSGVVGAGKSTAARAIVEDLRAAGCEAVHVRFQDFIRWTNGGKAPRRRGEGCQTEDVRKDRVRWAGYRRRRLTLRIAAGYVFRTLLFRARLRRWPRRTILVFDRYFYDSLVHFDLTRGQVALKLLLRSIPPPDQAALLMIPAPTILERRPDYAREYAEQVALGYERLAARLPGIMVVETIDFAAVNETADRIAARALRQDRYRGASLVSGNRTRTPEQ